MKTYKISYVVEHEIDVQAECELEVEDYCDSLRRSYHDFIDSCVNVEICSVVEIKDEQQKDKN